MDPAPPEAPPPRRLLVWDAPNIDVALGTLLGGRAPRPEERPRFDALGRWLVERTGQGEIPEACVFTNVVPGRSDQLRGWVDVLRANGFAVFAKPKLADEDDIDADLLAHVRRRVEEGPMAEVIVASADQYRDFADEDLEHLGERMPLTVLGFREFNRSAIAMEDVTFIDLETIPGLFDQPLTREVPLDLLPPEGAWLPPRASLLDLFRPAP
jgi:uncharacterized protein